MLFRLARIHATLTHFTPIYTASEQKPARLSISRAWAAQRHIKAIMFSRANCCFCEVHVFSMDFSIHPAARASTVFSASPTFKYFAHFFVLRQKETRQTLNV